MNVLLTTAYWPNLHYFFYILNSGTIYIEQFENYQKQSYRNRTRILTANGVLDLSIPVQKKGLKEFTKDISISYKENWQIKHWRAIISAYKNSPYFEHFEQDIFYFYSQPFDSLLQYNTEQLQLLSKLLRLKKEIILNKAFEKNPADLLDLRELIHPKVDFAADLQAKDCLEKPYYQTFDNKFAFQPNLSMLDLLFNKGLEVVNYLEI